MEAALAAVRDGAKRAGRIVVLTGAGVSAESGIPTFRGREGYWTVGAREYHPQELATRAAFARMPWDVWAWYLYRRGVCRRAAPNAGHRALVTLASSSRFSLITQNVDGLHVRAGSPRASTYEIHGDIELARCADECVPDRFPIPAEVLDLDRGAAVSAEARTKLMCPRCGAMARPHVLWFDESYDEERFHLDTVRRVAREAALLVVAGTSAQTNLPWQVVTLAGQAGAVIVDVNTEDNPFGDLAHAVARTSAATALPLVVDTLADI